MTDDDTRALREDEGRFSLWVGQEEPNGCGIACVAMLTGKTYAQVKAEVEADERVQKMIARPIAEGGLHGPAQDYVLQRAGYWLRKEYAVRCEHWPPAPFAALHICQVVQPSGNAHAVVMLASGEVLDPLREGCFSLSDWPRVNHVIGLLHEPSNNAAIEFAAGLRYRDEAEPSEAEVEAAAKAVVNRQRNEHDLPPVELDALSPGDYHKHTRWARIALSAARKASP